MTDQFYSRDEEGRFETHETEAAARRCAEEILDTCQEEASDNGWPEGTGDIEWGRLIPLGECVASNERESDRSDFDYLIDYNLKDLPDPTAELRSSLESVTRERDALQRQLDDVVFVEQKLLIAQLPENELNAKIASLLTPKEPSDA